MITFDPQPAGGASKSTFNPFTAFSESAKKFKEKVFGAPAPKVDVAKPLPAAAPVQAPAPQKITFDLAAAPAPAAPSAKPMITFGPAPEIKAPQPGKMITFDPLPERTVRNQDFKDVVNLIPNLISGAVAAPAELGGSALEASNKHLGTNFPTTTTIPNIFRDDIHGGKNAYESHTLQQSYAERIKAGDSPLLAFTKTGLEGGFDVAMAAGLVKPFVGLTEAATKAALKSTIPEKLITPEMVSASKQQIRDFASGRDAIVNGGKSPLPEVIQQAFKSATSEGKMHMVRSSGIDVFTAKPSAVGRLFGISQEEADGLLKSLYGAGEGGARQGSAGALPGYAPENPRFAGMSAGMSTERVKRIGGEYPETLRPLAERAKTTTPEEFTTSLSPAETQAITAVEKNPVDFYKNVTSIPTDLATISKEDLQTLRSDTYKEIAAKLQSGERAGPELAQRYADIEKELDKRVSEELAKSAPLEAKKEMPAGDGTEIRPDYRETEAALKEREKLFKKEVDAQLPKTQAERAVVSLKRALFDEYKKAGKLPNSQFHKVDEVLSHISVELDEARPGERVFIGSGSDAKVTGVSSTFPKWVPENLRSRALFDRVLPALDLESQSFPRGSRQAELLNVILKEADRRLGIDTGPVRSRLVSDIRRLPEAKLEERDQRATERLMNKTAKETEGEIAKRDSDKKRTDDLKKKEAERQTELKAAEAKKTSLNEKISANWRESALTKGFWKKIHQRLFPIQHVDKVTGDLLQNWFNEKTKIIESADQTWREMREKGPQNMLEINAYEAGKPIRYIREALDELGTLAKREGLDFQFRDNYLPHVYKQSPETVIQATARMLKDKGMSDAEVTEYLAGRELPKEKAAGLKVTPNFVKERAFPSYSAAAKHGLTAKYRTPAQLIAHYQEALDTAVANRKLVERLISEAKLLPPEDAPDTWRPVTTRFARQGNKEGYYARPELADLLNGKFRDENDLDVWPRVAKTLGGISRFVQEIKLSAGVPYTNINYFSTGQAVKIVTTAAGNVAQGNLKNAVSNLKASFAFIRANSNALSAKWFYNKREYIIRMAHQGIDISGRVGNYKEVRGKIKERWHELDAELIPTPVPKDLTGTKRIVATAKSFAGQQAAFAKGMGSIAKTAFDKAFNEKTFGSMMSQVQVQLFADAFDNAVAQGLPEDVAEKYAADVTRITSGMMQDLGRGGATSDTLSSIFFAPKFREGLINTFYNAGKSFTPQNFGDPKSANGRALIYGMMIMYAVYNLINKKLNDHYLWDNPPGREFAIRYERDNGDTVYIEYMPSVFALPRNAVQGVLATARGDFSMATQKFGTAFSMPFKITSEVLANSDYFGRPIYSDTDDTKTKLEKIAAYVGLGTSHPFITEPLKYLQGSQPLYQTISIMLELPFKFGSVTKEQKGQYYDALDEQKKVRAKAKDKLRPLYEELQALKAEGKTAEANEKYYALPDDQRALYDQLKTDEKTKATNARKPAIKAVYEENQKLIKAGQQAEADKAYWDLSPADRKIYQSLKKSAEKNDGLDLEMPDPLPPGLPDKTKTSDKSIIGTVVAYAKAIGEDPVVAFKRITSGQKIRRVDGGAVVVERMSLEESEAEKQAQFAASTTSFSKKDLRLDHTVPLELGGSNDKDNLRLITESEWASYTPVENMLGKALRAGTIKKTQAQDLITKFKKGEMTAAEVKTAI